MPSAEELFKYRTGLEKAVPQRGGTKDYMPDGSWLQGKRLEKFHQEREAVIAEPRVQRIVDLVKGEWIPEKQLVELEKEMRNFWEHMGFVDKKRKWLFPEEALFLMESNVLEVWYHDIPLSIQQAYTMFLSDKFPLEYYQVYSHLRRIGYVVLRHQQSLLATKYERQIGLDRYVSKKDRKKVLKSDKEMIKEQESECPSPLKKLDIDFNEDMDDVISDVDLYSEGDSPHTIDKKMKSKSALLGTEEAVQVNQAEYKHEAADNRDSMCDEEQGSDDKLESQPHVKEISANLSIDYTANKELDVENVELGNGEYKLQKTQDFGEAEEDMEIEGQDNGHNIQRMGDNCSRNMLESSVDTRKETVQRNITRDNDDTESDDIENGEASQQLASFSQVPFWKIQRPSASQKLNLSNWNFNEIVFPDFGTGIDGVDDVKLTRPQGRLLPGHFDLAKEQYHFNRKEMINKKTVKYLNEEFSWNDESLEFSYPEIMTGHSDVKKSCKNWSEYKSCQNLYSKSWDRSQILSHLYGDEVKPLVLPEDAASTSAVLDKLHVIQEEKDKPDSQSYKDSPGQKPAFDIYAPSAKFKKSAPGIPEHRVCVAKLNPKWYDPDQTASAFLINVYWSKNNTLTMAECYTKIQRKKILKKLQRTLTMMTAFVPLDFAVQKDFVALKNTKMEHYERCSDPFPNLLQVTTMTQKLEDNVPLLWALVDSGDIAFFEVADLFLPVDITLG